MQEKKRVRRHYAPEALWARIERLLSDAGLSQRRVDAGALRALDHFHSGGFAATAFLPDWSNTPRGWRVLRIGSGFGRPARYLAAARGCDVTGIDLTEEYVEVAERLTGLCGLAGKVHFQVGDALSPAFPDRSFDVVWTQHVAMNIRDRDRFYRQAARVLIPGGHFITYDIVINEPSAPLHYPMPWAETRRSARSAVCRRRRGLSRRRNCESWRSGMSAKTCRPGSTSRACRRRHKSISRRS